MKRLLSILLSGVILASSVPMYSNAASIAVSEPAIAIKEKDPSGSSFEPTTSGLEEAILAIKQKITVPSDYTEFNYYFYDTNSYADAYWNLTWSNPTNYSYIQVNCDADYHITYFYQYDYSKKNSNVSKYLKSDLKEKADSFIKKIAPETTGNLEFVDADFEGIYSGNYVYNYLRKNNGVLFPDNTVTVSVNSISGEVAYASVNWLYDTAVPSSKTMITLEEATKLIKENMKMKLVYRSNDFRIYDKSGIIGSSTPTKAFLVYEPTLNYISVDANTGGIYLTRTEWVDTRKAVYGSKEEANASDAATTSSVQNLTEEEIKKISELKNLISKSKAISTITENTSLYLDKNLKSYSATLSKSENASGKTTYIWNVSLNDPRKVDYTMEKDYYRAYAYASVDAVSGKILSFYSSVKSYYDEVTQTWKSVKINHNKEKSKLILEKFLKTQAEAQFKNSILASETEDYIAYYKKEVPVYGGYTYQYNRVNENVEYPYNYLYGSVDGVTGKIYSFGSYWDDSVVFESTKSVISADKAMDYYLAKKGYGLKYEINTITKYDSGSKLDAYYKSKDSSSIEYKIRLVYRPDVAPGFISPFTGEQLNYNGEIYKETSPYAYNDIENKAEYHNVFLLADMNIGFEGGKFLPKQAITMGEMRTLLQNVGYGFDTNKDSDSTSKNLITREELAYLFIVKMGLEKVSKIPGIYKADFADAYRINEKYLGAVALAKGLELMKADVNNDFNPKNHITRLEAVDFIMSFIELQQESLFY